MKTLLGLLYLNNHTKQSATALQRHVCRADSSSQCGRNNFPSQSTGITEPCPWPEQLKGRVNKGVHLLIELTVHQQRPPSSDTLLFYHLLIVLTVHQTKTTFFWHIAFLWPAHRVYSSPNKDHLLLTHCFSIVCSFCLQSTKHRPSSSDTLLFYRLLITLTPYQHLHLTLTHAWGRHGATASFTPASLLHVWRVKPCQQLLPRLDVLQQTNTNCVPKVHKMGTGSTVTNREKYSADSSKG